MNKHSNNNNNNNNNNNIAMATKISAYELCQMVLANSKFHSPVLGLNNNNY